MWLYYSNPGASAELLTSFKYFVSLQNNFHMNNDKGQWFAAKIFPLMENEIYRNVESCKQLLHAPMEIIQSENSKFIYPKNIFLQFIPPTPW